MKIIKNIRTLINFFGYDVRKINQKGYLDLYVQLYGEEAVAKRRFYNIGAGNFYHPAWTNVDHSSEWYRKAQGRNLNIDWDLLSLIPIPVNDNCAEIVYSSHTVEHISDQAAAHMFKEAYRILKEGGIFRITMPDIDLHFRAYQQNDRRFYYLIKRYSKTKECKRVKLNKPLAEASIQQLFLWHFASNASTLHADGAPERIGDEELDSIFREREYAKALDYCISKCSFEVQKKYPGGHINWWNRTKLLEMLKQAGFKRPYVSGYGQSICPVLRDTLLFDNTRPKISLYAEAVK